VLAAACLLSGPGAAFAQQGSKPVKVFILAGQSNMEGKAKVSLLEHQIKAPETKELFAHLHEDGKWVEREDVWIKFLDRKGNLTVGFGSPDRIGPELEFGNTVGNHYDEQVLIVKTAWGGKSLYRDFRPPSSGDPPAEHLQRELERSQKKNPQTTMEEVRARYGAFYRQMLDEIHDTLANLGDHFPQYRGQGCEIAGFVWLQGWNDMINAEYTAAYTENMVNFIRDVRKDLKAPNLPFVIGVLGVGGVEEEPNPKKQAFKSAQAAAGDLPEFKGNVAVVQTDQCWDMTADAVFKRGWRENFDEWQTVGSDRPYHYLGSVKCYSRIGKAFGGAIIELGQRKR
jgi:alpha-galactosidase